MICSQNISLDGIIAISEVADSLKFFKCIDFHLVSFCFDESLHCAKVKAVASTLHDYVALQDSANTEPEDEITAAFHLWVVINLDKKKKNLPTLRLSLVCCFLMKWFLMSNAWWEIHRSSLLSKLFIDCLSSNNCIDGLVSSRLVWTPRTSFTLCLWGKINRIFTFTFIFSYLLFFPMVFQAPFLRSSCDLLFI